MKYFSREKNSRLASIDWINFQNLDGLNFSSLHIDQQFKKVQWMFFAQRAFYINLYVNLVWLNISTIQEKKMYLIQISDVSLKIA